MNNQLEALISIARSIGFLERRGRKALSNELSTVAMNLILAAPLTEQPAWMSRFKTEMKAGQSFAS